MLRDLMIQQFALIEHMELNFNDGFTVLTGETGAGKSIIIDALTLALGGRASQDFIRTGEEEALIQIFFQISHHPSLQEELEEGGYSGEEELLLGRHISQDGRNKSFINGRRATLGQLREMGSHLMEIHGQHHHQALLHRENHLRFLDSFGGADLLEKREAVAAHYHSFQRLLKRWQGFNQREQERLRRIDLLSFQLQELQAAGLSPGEEEDLRSEKRRLSGAQQLKEGITASFNHLEGEEGGEASILSSLSHIKWVLGNLLQVDDTLQEIFQLVQNGFFQLQEASYLLRDYLDHLQLDPQQLQTVEERLMFIGTLKRKYGPQVEDILQYQEEIAQELEQLKEGEETQEALGKRVEGAREEYQEAALCLRQLRKKAAQDLQDLIVSVLKELKMEMVRFLVSFAKRETPQESGLDSVEFLLSTNPGEHLKPLHRIASGGELSRIMLALKAGLAHLEGVETLIFDEIDSGIGGKTAYAVGEKLASLAQKHQVICVTHLPQIAAMADHHFFIYKEVEGERTRIKIKELAEEDRIKELARMLGGKEMTSTALSHAKELLSKAWQKKGG